MKKSLTLFLFFLLSGNFACTDDYDFRPYEPEKSTVQELTLLKYNFLADGETALADFSNIENYGSWVLDERGLTFDGQDGAASISVWTAVSLSKNV